MAVGEAECPETLLLDRGRLVAAQNELQRLSLTAAALLIAAQLLAMKRLPPGTASPENRRWAGRALWLCEKVSQGISCAPEGHGQCSQVQPGWLGT